MHWGDLNCYKENLFNQGGSLAKVWSISFGRDAEVNVPDTTDALLKVGQKSVFSTLAIPPCHSVNEVWRQSGRSCVLKENQRCDGSMYFVYFLYFVLDICVMVLVVVLLFPVLIKVLCHAFCPVLLPPGFVSLLSLSALYSLRHSCFVPLLLCFWLVLYFSWFELCLAFVVLLCILHVLDLVFSFH